MGTPQQRFSWLRLIGTVCLIALSFALPQPAPVFAAACRDGFALWANTATRSDALLVSGSVTTVSGAVRSNSDVLVSGSNNTFTAPITHTAGFANGGDDNTFAGIGQAPAEAPPVSYALSSYAPGGAVAAAALAAGRYTVVNGDLDVAEPTTLSGLYYVTGNAKLAASDVRGVFTIVAAGTIDVSGSRIDASPYADGLLLFAGEQAPGSAVIKVAGSDSQLRGVIYGPGGMVELSGGSNSHFGLVLGDTLTLNGSSLSLSATPGYCPGAGIPPTDSTGPFVAGEVLIKLVNAADLAAVARAYALDPTPVDQFGTRPIYRLRILDGTSPQFKTAQLAGGDDRIAFAEPNYLAQDPETRRGRGSWVAGATGGGYLGQWAPELLGLEAAHRVTRGEGITVAVLDTGVDLSHPALAGRLVPGFDFVDFDGDPSEEGVSGPTSGFGHGTHVAGLVLLAAPAAKIMPVRVLDRGGVGNVWVLAEALIFAAELGRDGVALSGDEAQVINLSLGTVRPTRLLQDLVAETTCAPGDDDDDDQGQATARCGLTGGAIILAAAGNGGDSTPQYPAAENVPGSLAIGASTRADTVAAFSTFGPWVRLAAPGEEIISTVPGGAYGTWSGTSMATPLAAGVAALVRAADSGLSAEAVTERLVATGRPIDGVISRRLDAAAAVGALGVDPTPAPAPRATHFSYLPLAIR